MCSRFRFCSLQKIKKYTNPRTRRTTSSRSDIRTHTHNPRRLHTIPVHDIELNGIFNGLQGSSAAGDSIIAAAMTPLGRLGRQWNRTGITWPQDWHYQQAHLCCEWDPFHDLHQILITLGQKRSVVVGVCESVDVKLWVRLSCQDVRKAVKGFSVCMNVCVCVSDGACTTVYILMASFLSTQESWQPTCS